MLPVETQLDTGILDKDETEEEASLRRRENASNRKRQRQEQRDRIQAARHASPSSASSVASVVSDQGTALAEVVQEGFQMQTDVLKESYGVNNQISAIHLLLVHGSADEKERALAVLRRISNI
jgi:hypothetical protein